MQIQYENLSVIKSQRLSMLSGTPSFNFYMYLQLRAHNDALNLIKNMTDGRQMRQIPVVREKETQVCWAVDQQPLLASSLLPKLLKKLQIILVVFFVF